MKILQCGSRQLDLSETRIMGVINVTPDSFSDGGRHLTGRPDLARTLETAHAMLAEGAAILDVGGESTRPGAEPVTEDEETRRVMPVLERLLELDTAVSLDTSKPGLAARALAAGAHVINDVTGGRSPAMLEAVADSDAALCIMHMQGEPPTMQRSPRYDDVVAEVHDYLRVQVERCRRAGIVDSRLLVDPGFGFGKSLDHNLTLLKNLRAVRVDDVALLVGLSRKGMIGTLTGRPVEGRAAGSAAAALLAAQRGANVVRVHDVAETADALKMLASLDVGGHNLDTGSAAAMSDNVPPTEAEYARRDVT